MKRKLHASKALGLVVFLALFIYAAAAPSPAPTLKRGVVYEIETTYHSGSPSKGSERSKMSVEKPKVKMEILPDGGSSGGGVKDEVIFNGERREMVVVNHHDQSYMVIDSETAGQLGGQVQGQMQQAMKDVEKHLEQLDPKQREMAEKMLKGKPGGPGAVPGAPQPVRSDYRRTGERATKQGYPCVRYDVFRGEEKVRELWVTDWDNVRGGQDVVDTFKEMASFYDELLDSFEQMTGSGGFFSADRSPIESLTKIDGFPIVTRDFEGGELESETVLESVTERDLDPDAFEPPKGYRLRTMGPQ